VAAGSPEEMVRQASKSYTGQILAKVLT
jgi:hypothetical protein